MGAQLFMALTTSTLTVLLVAQASLLLSQH
jgi:hypothetical protein